MEIVMAIVYVGLAVGGVGRVGAADAEDADEANRAEYRARREVLTQRGLSIEFATQQVARSGVTPETLSSWYTARRELARERFRFGDWCARRGLADEARAEFTNAAVLDPGFEDAWRRLGCVRRGTLWITPDQAVIADNEAAAQRKANARWDPIVKSWARVASVGIRREEAVHHFMATRDPRVVATVGRVLADSTADRQKLAVGILGAVASPESSRMLARMTLDSASAEVRAAAAVCLKSRPISEFGLEVTSRMETPATYSYEPVGGPGSRGHLTVDTPLYHLERTYDAPPAFRLNSGFHGYVGYDPNGLPVAMGGSSLARIESNWRFGKFEKASVELAQVEARTAQMVTTAQLKASYAQQSLAADLRWLARNNKRARETNERAAAALEAACGVHLDAGDAEGGRRWYYDKVGYSYYPPPKVSVQQSLPTMPAPSLTSCFAEGTLVRTRDGLLAIERIRSGDKVLSQSASGGEAGYRTVLVIHHNPPAATVRVGLEDGETLLPSVYHRFLKASGGWRLARDLRVGDELRTAAGTTRVVRVEAGRTVPVFNLDVESTHTFFVGLGDVLVHDNTVAEEVATAAEVGY